MPSLGDYRDQKSVVDASRRDQVFSRGALKTTDSQLTEPKLSMVTYDASAALQGFALYKPPGLGYDTFNQELSKELTDMGVEARWRNRDDKLTPYDVFVKDPDPSTLGDLDVGSAGGGAPNPGSAGGPPPLTGGSKDAFLVGDSISVGTDTIGGIKGISNGWNITVDAVVGRPPQVGLQQLRARNGNFGSCVIINLGTNPGPPAAQWIGEAMQIVANVPRICFVTVNEWDHRYTSSVNAEIHKLPAQNPRVVIADWWAIISGQRNLLAGDGVHCTGEGYKKLAKLIIDTIGPAPTG